MEITKELLIERLITGNVNEYNIGYNAAIIDLLKTSNSKPQHDAGYAALKKALNDDNLFYTMSNKAISDVIDAIKNGHKLQAVKNLKNATALSLIVAKDVIDLIDSNNI